MTSFNERLRAAMLSDAEAAENKRLRAAPATAPEFPADWAQMIHYPECWDTAAYPELRDAIHEALAWSGCSVCKPSTAPERKPMPILEVNARWEQSVLGITRLQYYQVIREVESFHGITGGKP